MHVVATAGHVDHGKSTLVRALTGQDPDRLAEEKRRGLTIELGYCWTSLEGAGEVAFVDVPGHERFITTMLAGVGPVPVVMLIVAADDTWMPQTAEHLAALNALGVEHGILVVTRSDLADPGPALARARAEVEATSLADIPDVVVSGLSGAGLEELRSTLAEVLRTVPAPPPDAVVRLWVDRRFHVHGSGTIVTGTLPAGTIMVGDRLTTDTHEVRVRNLESLGKPRSGISGVARVALNLGGRGPDAISRGDALVTPGRFEYTRVVDVRLSGPVQLPAEPVLHIGSAHLGVRARVLAPSLARLTLGRSLPLRFGDRAVLRDPGSRMVWGVNVLDPVPPKSHRRDLAAHDGTLASELRLRGFVRGSLLRRIGVPISPVPDGALAVGDWLIAPDRVSELRLRLAELVATQSVASVEAARVLGVPDSAIIQGLITAPLRLEDGRVTGPPTVSVQLRDAAAILRGELAGFAAAEAKRLGELGLDGSSLTILHRAGLVLRIDPKTVLLPGSDELALTLLSGLPQPFTTSAARQALDTSRRVAIALLVHLDRTGRTIRLSDDRRRVDGMPMES